MKLTVWVEPRLLVHLHMEPKVCPKMDIIIGQGNKYVTEAKRQVSGTVGIDMLAGPSEVLIIADETAPAQWVAVDLLAKCEHDPNSISILVTTSRKLAEEVEKWIERGT